MEKSLREKNLNDKAEELLLTAASLHMLIEALVETVRRMTGNGYPVEDMEDWIFSMQPLSDGYVDIIVDDLITKITAPEKKLPFRYPVKGETV